MTRRGDFGCLCALFIGMVSNMTMSRRDFVKVSGTGLMALLVSGCGIGAAAGAVGASGSSSGSGSSGNNGAPPSGLAKDYKAAGKPMKIVVINSSPHPKDESTSVFLSEQFTAGAQKAGRTVFTFDAARAQTHPCIGCDKCHMDGPCVFKDDIENTLMPKMLDADMLVLVTPLYYFGMSAQLKTIVDRFYARSGRLHGKRSLLIATAYNSDNWTMEALADHYDTLVRYMEWDNVGMVLGTGCGARSLVEKSDFGPQAEKIGEMI